MLKRLAVSACPNSCSVTQKKIEMTNSNVHNISSIVLPLLLSRHITQPMSKRNVQCTETSIPATFPSLSVFFKVLIF
jgi:hypothetical protein